VAHVVGHGAEHADGRELHDEARVLKHRLRDAVEEEQRRFSPLAHAGQGDAEEAREHHHWQKVALRRVLDQVRGEHVHGDVPARLRRGLGDIRVGGHVEGQTVPGANPVRDAEAEEERDGRHDFKVNERLGAHAAHGLEVARLHDAHHDGGEEQRHDEALDQRDEGLRHEPKGLIGVRELVLGEEPAKENAEHQGHDDDEGARAIPGQFHKICGFGRGCGCHGGPHC
jgi:hypothetical protein